MKTDTTNVLEPEIAEAIHDKAVSRMDRDIRKSAANMTREQAQLLVAQYYEMQEQRIRSSNQVKALGRDGKPHEVVDWLLANAHTLEKQVAGALDVYSNNDPVGQWARSIVGVGPVLASGLLAHIDITKAPTCGHVLSFAGLNPNVKWRSSKDVQAMIDAGPKGETPSDCILRVATMLNRRPERVLSNAQRRADEKDGKITPAIASWALKVKPFNTGLKVLFWKLGESFVKVSGNPKSHFGRIYRERKLLEIERNDAGLFREQAEEVLRTKKIGKNTEAYRAYSQGKLPPAHLHARATRYASRHFCHAYFGCAYWHHHGREEPTPYILAHDPKHAHYISWREVT